MTPRDALFWSLFLGLMPQALWVRKTAPRFTPAEGPTHGETGHGEKSLALLAIGDSIIAGVGANTLDNALVGRAACSLAELAGARVRWTACGRSGATSHQIATRMLPDADDAAVDAVLVSAGVNDVISLHGIGRWRRDINTLLGSITHRWPGAVVALSGLPPMDCFPALPQPLRSVFGLRARQFDEVLRERSRAFDGAVHIPLDFEADADTFSADGFHPSEASYAQFGRVAARAVFDLMTRRRIS